MAQSTKPSMKLWALRPKDPLEPPFHFAGVPALMIVAAPDAKQARAIAASNDTAMVPAGFAMRGEERVAVEAHSPWTDDGATSCVELAPNEAGVIARDMGA